MKTNPIILRGPKERRHGRTIGGLRTAKGSGRETQGIGAAASGLRLMKEAR